MTRNDELVRFQQNSSGEIPPEPNWSLSFHCETPNASMQKIMFVMALIINQERELWPDDDYWMRELPQWLVKTFKAYTQQELSALISDHSTWTNLTWSFGSWLDRMRDRDWEWWSYKVESDKVTIYLSVNGYPISVKKLEHLVVAAGCSEPNA